MATYGNMPQVDFSILGDLGKTYQDAKLRAGRERSLAELGQGANIADVSQRLFQAGDIEGGLSLAKLADAQALRKHNIARDERDFALRKEEIARSQSNADRAYGLQEKQFGLAQQQTGFEPNPAVPGGQRPIPGGPKDPAYLEQVTGAKDKTQEQVTEREKAVTARGLDKNDPQIRAYILTGKLPREDQQPLTATDKNAILEADDLVQTNESTITALKQAKQISPKAYGHSGALNRGKIDAMLGNQEGLDTVELDNLVTGQALAGLKAVFGAAPTEGERKILLEIQGSVSLPDAARQKIYDRAIALAEKRMEFNRQKASALRGGTYYKAGGGAQPAASATPPASTSPTTSTTNADKKRLKFNPATGEFE